MPPRRSKKNDIPVNNNTLGKFFTITSSKSQTPRRVQPSLTALFSKAKKREDGADDVVMREHDTKPNVKSEVAGPTTRGNLRARQGAEAADNESSDSSSVGSVIQPTEGIESIMLSDSDSDSGLVDASTILGPALNTAVPATPVRGFATGTSKARGTPYRNSLKSLVQASRRQKYDVEFLENRMEQTSSDGEGVEDSAMEQSDGGSQYNGAVEHALEALPQIDVERIRLQLGVVEGAQRKPMRLSLFHRHTRGSSLGQLPYGDGRFEDIEWIDSDIVEDLCKSNIGNARFFRHLIGSHWIAAQAHRGWRLTQNVGDVLVRAMCLDHDDQLAASAYETLCVFLDLQASTWELQQGSFLMLLQELQGIWRDRAEEVPDPGKFGYSSSSSSSIQRSPTPNPYVEIATNSRPAAIMRTNAERVALLMDIASRGLEELPVKDSSRVVALGVGVLLDSSNRIRSAHIQQGLARLIGRISPPSKWVLVWGECVLQLARQLGHLEMPAQLRIVDSLPMASKRCMQLRHSLAFLFLRGQSAEGHAAEQMFGSMAPSATLPGQIVLRMVGEMMDTDEELFRVGPETDFVRLEAAVGLLGNVLDSVQAMRDVRDEVKVVYRRLDTISQRISDGMADKIDKTLAKDAVQTLLVRVFMTALSDAHERLKPAYSTANTLHSWLPAAQLSSGDSSDSELDD
ncbi:hypothetical protein H4R20_002020 [Coemansia guatemalensis]|uniref:Uncharacterized protein n=1 Tax=Coemansia guatemalensis TaxID=2761395 RepID=A0A9W8HVY2_9FUNG|nr:hypothetical protein H4R20_002020 [Coemansia guatemalensis]